MTDDEICNLAVEYDAMSGDVSDLIKFARAVESRTRVSVIGEWFKEGVRVEREACAKVADEVTNEIGGEYVLSSYIAAAIRARGE